MEVGKKEAITCKKYDKNLKDFVTSTIFMIDETLAHDFITSIQQKEEYKNSFIIKKFLPKDLFKKLENKSRNGRNPDVQYKAEKGQQFRIWKNDLEPYYLKNALNSIKII